MKEIIIENQDGNAGGWYRCGRCEFYILLNGRQYYKAEALEQQKKQYYVALVIQTVLFLKFVDKINM